MTDQPITYTLAAAIALTGISRSQIYRELSAGKIKALKNGKSLLIEAESLRNHVANLPSAVFRDPPKL